jgi:hypothetical protein
MRFERGRGRRKERTGEKSTKKEAAAAASH